MADTPKRRSRRQFTDEFKAGAVRLVLDEGKTVGAAARDLDLTETALREWVRRAQADRSKGRTGLTLAEREELARLRKEVRELRTERANKSRNTSLFAGLVSRADGLQNRLVERTDIRPQLQGVPLDVQIQRAPLDRFEG
jgi:transposase